MPRMAIRMAWAAQWSALGPYLGTMLPKYAVQLAQIIGPVTGILVAPVVGVFSDRCTSKFGRRRPFLVYGAITTVFCWTAMGYTRQIGDALGDTGSVNIVQTPINLMIADFAGDRQTLGAAIGQGWSTLGAIMVSGYIYCFGAAHLTLRWFLFMLSLVMAGTVTVACLFGQERARERVEQPISTWAHVKSAFCSIYEGFKTLPIPLLKFCIVIFCVMYGFSAYNGNKGQFFGVVVFDGESTGANTCKPNCSEAQNAYNHGVRVAGGSTDIAFSLLGYGYSWVLPWLVKRFGARCVLAVALIPQSLLVVMAFTTVVSVDVAIVVSTTFTLTTVFALNVPVIVHVIGSDAEIGVYVGVFNAANCLGQLLNFSIGAAIIDTPMGYRLPVFLGGIMSFFGIVFTVLFFKIKMHSL
ncbi:hypothetical protein BBO99_00003004 [Phytophthora kernoviae]|uniref:Major facilitator superfamily (MFS) profile domain-containing protein n=2 Tax=Phytophthora kernoviae TaxID=325452 RepID=A0A3R7NJ61_9STRA|nr:hypothetical protein G195_003465 [Phytophthora kernoviae 00238/432]KAG2528616.1 hypothetical protein JM16_002673 [Phytophthora kernoviae]KAG2529044.1 hypothetical protein JM18_002550 [Phytophthora kernoviae]RLN10105.1 hypothetical protein BBI17_003068 [Phytophthora kernoviae]RLN82321.1 hypothetical protein BBO99_00003004 [Phytophthora kernoviae]